MKYFLNLKKKNNNNLEDFHEILKIIGGQSEYFFKINLIINFMKNNIPIFPIK